MYPTLFKNICYVDPATKYQVRSLLDEDNDGHGQKGITEVLDLKGKRLWTIPIFIGRKVTHLSPDGKLLILTGDFYYGTATLQVSTDQVMATIFDEGKESQKIMFSQLFTLPATQIATMQKFKVMGGGWAVREDFVKDLAIDWQKRMLKFTLYDQSVKSFLF